ncbi:MAG: hypothetical protein ACLRMJ_02995 [Alistipes finegoldii]
MVARLAADNSDAATLQSKTLYVRIAAVTTSSIILEWEQAGDVRNIRWPSRRRAIPPAAPGSP